MKTVDQYRVIDSMEQHLLPDPHLIDGRTELDWICFLAEFASLVNFYDDKNRQAGDWIPFLAKDPVFLMATISKTPCAGYRADYTHLCTYLRKQIRQGKTVHELSDEFIRLFDMLTCIFHRIRQWIYYMHLNGDEYPLKTYVAKEVKTIFSRYFRAHLSLQKNLSLARGTTAPQSPAHALSSFPASADEMIWNTHNDHGTYWEVLGLPDPVKEKEPGPVSILEAITRVGDALFAFFKKVITQASSDFELVKTKKSNTPDTLLLRTFIDLLQVQQEQLNGITQKHLQFYYKEILKQQARPAVADQVFACAIPAKNNAVCALPSGTLLNAGMDAQQNPVLFSLPQNVIINPASLAAAYTLNQVRNTDGLCQLYIKNISSPSSIHEDENGLPETWKTFGGTDIPGAVLVKPAIAFSSPLLLLREGTRSILLTLTFFNHPGLSWPADTCYYLSTREKWLPVYPTIEFVLPTPARPGELQAIISIELEPGQPPIESFLVNPDGISALWPMFKIEFSSVPDAAKPPVIGKLKIEVQVPDIISSQLYNDYGALSTKTAFQPFGPNPLLNSSFILGNDEIFSKPVNKLAIQFCWNNLPRDLAAYYIQYNSFLDGSQNGSESTDNATADPILTECEMNTQAPAGKKNPGFFRRLWNRLTSLFMKKQNSEKQEQDNNCSQVVKPAERSDFDVVIPDDFSNSSFRVRFEYLQEKVWKKLRMKKVIPCPSNLNTITREQLIDQYPLPLFSEAAGTSTLLTSSCFVHWKTTRCPPHFIPDPAIQLSPLLFSDSATSGFIRMTLTNPRYGFGSALYAELVTYIAWQNALGMQKDTGRCRLFTKAPSFTGPAKLPFSPKLSAIKILYKAEQEYPQQDSNDNYPLQCFLYTAFNPYKAYDNTIRTGLPPTAEKKPGTLNIPLFHAYGDQGYLFLGMENIIPSTSMNWYFEMSQKNSNQSNTGFNYAVVSQNGWNTLPVLSDGTNGFSCSGIIQAPVPSDVGPAGFYMPPGKYWCCFSVNTNPDQYAQTVYLGANGFMAKRIFGTVIPAPARVHIPAGSIKGFMVATPQIRSITQPFASFGGRAPETGTAMNRRVAHRVKTKDRAVSADDIYRLITQEFMDICYVQSVFEPADRTTRVYVAGSASDPADPNGFLPFVNSCKREAIQAFLREKAPFFSNLRVFNFEWQYIRVYTSLAVKKGYEFGRVEKEVRQLLNQYLSPWMPGNPASIAFGEEISAPKLASCIQNVEGVSGIGSVTFRSFTSNDQQCRIIGDFFNPQPQRPLTGAVFVPYINHKITRMDAA